MVSKYSAVPRVLARGTHVVPGFRAAPFSLRELKNCFSFIAHFISLFSMFDVEKKSSLVNSDDKIFRSYCLNKQTDTEMQ